MSRLHPITNPILAAAALLLGACSGESIDSASSEVVASPASTPSPEVRRCVHNITSDAVFAFGSKRPPGSRPLCTVSFGPGAETPDELVKDEVGSELGRVLLDPSTKINAAITAHCKGAGACVSDLVSDTVFALGDKRPPGSPAICTSGDQPEPLPSSDSTSPFGAEDPVLTELLRTLNDPANDINRVLMKHCGG